MTVSPPQGTVTFLFTDIEGSTSLWEDEPQAMQGAVADHDRLLRDEFGVRGGYVFTTAGDSFAVAFARAQDAVDAAVAVQRRLATTAFALVSAPLKATFLSTRTTPPLRWPLLRSPSDVSSVCRRRC